MPATLANYPRAHWACFAALADRRGSVASWPPCSAAPRRIRTVRLVLCFRLSSVFYVVFPGPVSCGSLVHRCDVCVGRFLVEVALCPWLAGLFVPVAPPRGVSVFPVPVVFLVLRLSSAFVPLPLALRVVVSWMFAGWVFGLLSLLSLRCVLWVFLVSLVRCFRSCLVVLLSVQPVCVCFGVL